MKTGFSHETLFEYDESEIRQYLTNANNSSLLWNDVPERKNLYAQEQTDITLLYNLADKTNAVFNKFYINEKIIEESGVDELFRKISKLTGRVLGRAMFIKLPPKKSIAKHIDSGHHLQNCERIHLPIITDEHVKFIIDDVVYPMPAGVVCRINNNVPHSVENNSDNYRVHLVMDFVVKNDPHYDAPQEELNRFCEF
jgi:hypothetical protein